MDDDKHKILLIQLAELKNTLTIQMDELVQGQTAAFEKYAAADDAYRKELELYSTRENNWMQAGKIHVAIRFAGLALLAYIAYQVS